MFPTRKQFCHCPTDSKAAEVQSTNHQNRNPTAEELKEIVGTVILLPQ